MTIAWAIHSETLNTPNGWRVRRIGDLVSLVNGFPFSSEDFGPNGDMPLVRIRDLLGAEFETYVSGYIPRDVVLRNGDVVIGMDGDFNLSVWNRGEAALNQRLCLLRPKPGVDIRFIAYTLPGILNVINDLTFSTTVKHLSSNDILAERILLPSLEEQRRIADFLDAETGKLDQFSRARSRQARLVAEEFEALLDSEVQNLFSAKGEIPLRRITTKIEQGASPQCFDEQAGNGEWGVLKTSAVSAGSFNAIEHKRLPPTETPELRYRIKDGDLLMTRGSGSPSNVGVAAIANADGRNLLLSDLIYRIQLIPTWSNDSVAYFLTSRVVRGQVGTLLRGQSGQTIKLRGEDIREIRIPNVNEEEQQGFTTRVAERRISQAATQSRMARSLELLAERRQALITAAVTGQLDVTTARTGVGA